MENASKALLLAGGVLIAIIIIAILAYVFNSPGALQDELSATKNEEQLKAFNAGYEAYNKKAMRGIDIITLVNKAIDNNEKNPSQRVDIVVGIDIEVTVFDGLKEAGISEYTYTANEYAYSSLVNGKTTNDRGDETENITEFKSKRYFRCEDVEYKNGRIYEMKFEDITADVMLNMSDYTDMTRGETSLPEQYWSQ